MEINAYLLEAFSNLANIYSEMYDITMKDLYNLEISDSINSEIYNKKIKKLKNLRRKEERILQKISSDDINLAFQEINLMFKYVCHDDVDKLKALTDRFNYFVDEIYDREDAIEDIIEDVYDNLYDLEDFEDMDELDDDVVLHISIDINTYDLSTKLKTEFLKYINGNFNNQFIQYKYYNSFVFPKLGDNLYIANYNPDNLVVLSEDLEADMNNISEDVLKEDINMAWIAYADEAVEDFFNSTTVSHLNYDKVKLFYEEVKFTTKKISTLELAGLYNKYFTSWDEFYVVNEDALDYVKSLENDIIDELYDRKDFEDDMLNIESAEYEFDINVLDKNEIDKIYNVLDCSKDIHSIMSNLYFLEIKGLKNSSQYNFLLKELEEVAKKEQMYADSLQLDLNMEDISFSVGTIIENYLSNFVALKNEIDEPNQEILNYNFLLNRITNLIYMGRISNFSMYKDYSVPFYILKNFQLECLKQYSNYLHENKISYLKFNYEKILSDAALTHDFISANGNLSNMIILSDDDVCRLIDMDIEEYQFDKEQLLADYADKILYTLAHELSDSNNDLYEQVVIDYMLIALDVALNYIQEDDLEKVKSNYINMQNENKSKAYKNLNKSFKKASKNKVLYRKRH